MCYIIVKKKEKNRMKDLVIVESPSKAKTIQKYLGKNYCVMSSKGHIRDLATRGKGGLGVDVDNDFAPTYSISKEKKPLIKELKAAAQKADSVLLATDMDREGEAISWHLAQVLDLNLNSLNRIVFNEITRSAILNAVKNPRQIDMNLVRSQETRRILDRIIGFRLSALLKKKIKSKSAGRVQSVALKIICEREKEIVNFVPEEYWEIAALFKKGGQEFKAQLSKKNTEKITINSGEEAQNILRELSSDFKIDSLNNSSKKRNPYLPFTTSTLQQEASAKLGFSAKRTMTIAQTLYEGVDIGKETQGLITYMRTDSTRLSNEFVNEAFDYITTNYGTEYKGTYRLKNDENAQDAHEAIRPTYLANTPEKIKEYLTNDQYKLYRLIYIRALSSLMACAVNEVINVKLMNGFYTFVANGSNQVFDGFLKLYKEYDNSKDILLPSLEVDEVLISKEITPSQHFSEAPSRYSEAKLIKKLEEDGIGRPSTYATIIDTLSLRGYVQLKKQSESGKTKYFFPTEQGLLTNDKLADFFADIINEKYTASMENELDEIASSKLDYKKSLHNFYDYFMPLYFNALENMPAKEVEKTGEICPDCGGDLVIRNGRFGAFIACNNFPTCRFSKKLSGEEKEEPEHSGKMCPDCGSELLKRKNRFGTYFLGCSAYPKCKYLENIPGQEKTNKYKYRKKKNAKS